MIITDSVTFVNCLAVLNSKNLVTLNAKENTRIGTVYERWKIREAEPSGRDTEATA